MILDTMSQSNLEKILSEKQRQFDELQRKISNLQNNPRSEVIVSYSLDLNLSEQISYAKRGLFSLYRDLNGYTQHYKNDDSESDI